MTIQEIVKDIQAEIQKEVEAFDAERERLLEQIAKAETKRDAAIDKLNAKRDAAVMKEKLKDFPAKLVKEHTHCSICGAEMRPFSFMQGEQTVKAWACQVGGLAENHDLVRI